MSRAAEAGDDPLGCEGWCAPEKDEMVSVIVVQEIVQKDEATGAHGNVFVTQCT